eukprot:Gb_01508 [translate_table: standard]
MESQNKLVFWLNPSQVPEQVRLDTALPWTKPGKCGVSNLTSLKPGSQTAQFFEAFEATSLIKPIHSNSQVYSAESGVKPSCVAAASPSPEVFNGKETSSCYFHTCEATPQGAEFNTSATGGLSPFQRKHDFRAWNGVLSEKIKMQLSETCQKRFIMFDQTGSRGRIIFHPNQFSTLLPNYAKAKEGMNAQNMDSEEVMRLKVPVAVSSVDWDASYPACREAMTSAFAALQKMRADRLNSVPLGNFGNEFVACSAEESASRVSCNGLSQANTGDSQSQLHEDTEDLEALLNSEDEESSTGHSPSDVSGNNDYTPIEEDSTDITSGIRAKRRRIEKEDGEEEVNSMLASIKDSVVKAEISDECRLPDVSVVDTSSWDPEVQPEQCNDVKDDEYNANLFYGSSFLNGSEGSANEQMWTCKCNLGSAKKLKKEKIKKTVRLLRSMIPGGDCMDTAIVLDEAIQCVKLLQVKVKKLGANQHDN